MPSPSPSRRQRCVGVTARRLPPQDQRTLQAPCTCPPSVRPLTAQPPTHVCAALRCAALRWALAPAHPRGPVPRRPAVPSPPCARTPSLPASASPPRASLFPEPLARHLCSFFPSLTWMSTFHSSSFFPSFLLTPTPTTSLARTASSSFTLHPFFSFFFRLSHANQNGTQTGK